MTTVGLELLALNINKSTAKNLLQKIDGQYGDLELVTWMGDDLTVVNAARVSHGKRKDELDEADKKLIFYLAENKHESPFRHVQLQFRVKAPIFVSRQWIKHVVGCGFTDLPWNEVSQRYTEVLPEFYVPPSFKHQATKNKQASAADCDADGQAFAKEWYTKAMYEGSRAYYDLLELGVSREQARMVLPLCTYTEWIWTASLQAVVHFVKLRKSAFAQPEICQYAARMEELADAVCPISFGALMRYT